tara:strand:- start:53912 stop:54556 length:645 start_codon:yes stop_codon:yes gene_type:complete
MIKHVGKHGDKRVAVIFREVPDEGHMALVVYPDQLQQNLHDDLMNAIQSDKGQEARNLGEALHSIVGSDGQTILNNIHKNRFMKKVRTQDIIMMPRPNTPGVRLDEINKIINDLDTGSKAAQDMAKLDAQAGLADPDKNAAAVQAAAAVVGTPSEAGILSDSILAEQLVEQANQMKTQMASLEKEVTRLMEEAATLNPALAVKKKRGRPAKAAI